MRENTILALGTENMLKSSWIKINAIVVPICSWILWAWPQYWLHVFLFICIWVVFGFWRISRQIIRDEEALEFEMQMMESKMMDSQ